VKEDQLLDNNKIDRGRESNLSSTPEKVKRHVRSLFSPPKHRNLNAFPHSFPSHIMSCQCIWYYHRTSLIALSRTAMLTPMLASYNNSSLPLATLFSIASRIALSSNTGPCPSHLAHFFNLSPTSPTSTLPALKSGWLMMKSHVAPGASNLPPSSASTIL
jgi:hypothetical protein